MYLWILAQLRLIPDARPLLNRYIKSTLKSCLLYATNSSNIYLDIYIYTRPHNSPAPFFFSTITIRIPYFRFTYALKYHLSELKKATHPASPDLTSHTLTHTGKIRLSLASIDKSSRGHHLGAFSPLGPRNAHRAPRKVTFPFVCSDLEGCDDFSLYRGGACIVCLSLSLSRGRQFRSDALNKLRAC